MNLEIKAKLFAINAHRGQVRKSEPEKPMIIHPLNVGNILKQYLYDENVVAAGYLHDVVEDTKYTFDDIEKEFGSDIASLVYSASEPDKSLSWEERKQHTINESKKLDIRHKAVICADKISNLEDLIILSEIKGEYDFSKFKRGYTSQKWYYTEIYNSLVSNEDENLPMFRKLKELINYMFYNKNDYEYIQNVIFLDNQDEFKKLKLIHYKKEEVYKLKKLLTEQKPYVIEFTGTPRTGKTSIINTLKDFFEKKGFTVTILEEFTTSLKYKQEIYPILKDNYKKIVNFEIPKYVLNELKETIKKNPDIIIIDRSLLDRLIWIDRLYEKDGITIEEYSSYKEEYIPLIKEYIDIVISTYTDSLTALKRDYKANLSLEKRKFLNIENIDEYNHSLKNIEKLAEKENINFKLFDTTSNSQREVSLLISDFILNNMKSEFLKQINNEYKLIKEKK